MTAPKLRWRFVRKTGPGAAPGPWRVLRQVLAVLSSLALTFIGLTAITFFIGRVMPVDPVLSIVGDRAPQDVYDRVYQELGLDEPISAPRSRPRGR